MQQFYFYSSRANKAKDAIDQALRVKRLDQARKSGGGCVIGSIVRGV